MKKMSKDELKQVFDILEKAKCFTIETDEFSIVCGNTLELLQLYSKQTASLIEKTNITEIDLKHAFKIGIDDVNENTDEINKDMEKEIDKKIKSIEKLMEMLKELRKEVK